ncbi:putative ribonuclease H-like domain-containing protein [Tanacetum coccineum]
MTHPHPQKKICSTSSINQDSKINTASASINIVNRPINIAASTPLMNHPRPKSNAFKRGYSQSSRPFNRYYANKNRINVNTVRVKNTTARDRAVGNPQLKEYKEKSKFLEKGKIKIGSLDFDDVYFCKELKYNLFSVSQICDKKNNVLFTNTECLVLSSDFKLLDESQVLLRVPRKDNIYSVDQKSVVPTGGLTCLIAKGDLVKGLPSKIFANDHSCVACQKGKQHKASYKTKLVNSISKPLHMLHMDLFGPTNVKSLMKKCDNGTEFKNSIMNQFCKMKGIKREFSVARTPQQNGVVKRKNRTLIEAARTMLVNSKLPTTF